ncbi:MAG TPA: hypothetical protein VGB79_01720 [Allosphingosinicella sp.]|jgi:hypothetical protein
MNLLARVAAAQSTIDRFLFTPFEWGKADCAHLVGHLLIELGLDDPNAKARNYSTELGARRAMRHLGYADMTDAIDALGFERIPPAAALPGDIVGYPGGEDGKEWTALGVALGQDRILGFANGRGEWGPVSVCTVAWRVA